MTILNHAVVSWLLSTPLSAASEAWVNAVYTYRHQNGSPVTITGRAWTSAAALGMQAGNKDIHVQEKMPICGAAQTVALATIKTTTKCGRSKFCAVPVRGIEVVKHFTDVDKHCSTFQPWI